MTVDDIADDVGILDEVIAYFFLFVYVCILKCPYYAI
jgi:hypothetical protein